MEQNQQLALNFKTNELEVLVTSVEKSKLVRGYSNFNSGNKRKSVPQIFCVKAIKRYHHLLLANSTIKVLLANNTISVH